MEWEGEYREKGRVDKQRSSTCSFFILHMRRARHPSSPIALFCMYTSCSSGNLCRPSAMAIAPLSPIALPDKFTPSSLSSPCNAPAMATAPAS